MRSPLGLPNMTLFVRVDNLNPIALRTARIEDLDPGRRPITATRRIAPVLRGLPSIPARARPPDSAPPSRAAGPVPIQ